MDNQSLRKRRNLPAAKKYAILEECRQRNSSKAEILRREGLYSTDLQRFERIARDGAISALGKARPGRLGKPDVSFAEHDVLRQELARKEAALCELATEFTLLKKKVNGE